MIIDCHAHVFTHWIGACGHPTRDIHNRYLQRMITRTAASTFRTRDWARADTKALYRTDDAGWSGLTDVDFRVGRFGQLEFTHQGEDHVIQYMPVGMQEMTAPPELMLAQMMYAGVDHCLLQAGGSYGAMTEMNAFAQQQYPGRMTGMMHVDEAKAGTEAELAKVDHAFHVLKLGSLYFNVDSLSRHGFPWPLDAKEMAPFWAKLAELGIVLCLELSSGPTYDKAGYMGHIVALGRILARHRDLRVHLAMSPPVAFFAKSWPLRVPRGASGRLSPRAAGAGSHVPDHLWRHLGLSLPRGAGADRKHARPAGRAPAGVGLRHAQRRALLHLQAIARLRAQILPVPYGAGEGSDPGRQLRRILRHRQIARLKGLETMSDGIFSGLRVIDCASWIAGPAAATILSDFGAEVIKIEPPGAGDPWRASSPVPGKTVDYWWQLTSRNKRSLAIDLKAPEGLAVLYRLLATTDVFVTNFPLPVRERLKIAAADLLAINPRLVYGSITAYGEVGEEAARTGFDATAYWARTGLMDMVRVTPETEPVRSMPGMGDHPTATALYAAIVTALYRREKTGRGGVVQTSLLQNGLWANGCFVQNRLFGEHVAHRPPRSGTPSALANHYRCRDGRWFLMALHNEARQLPSFLKAIEAEHLAEDPRFATQPSRRANAKALTAILEEIFAKRDLAEWRTILEKAGVTFGPVCSVNEAADDEQSRKIGALVPFADGANLTVSSPFHVDGVTKVAPVRAPAVGQHSETVLRDAGYSADEIAKLKALGVL